MDENGNGPRLHAAALHRRTEELIVAAGEINDRFLQYLYGLALRHLQEQAGIRNEKAEECTWSGEPAIDELASRLKALARSRGG
jgi:hypothetical protein